MASTPVLDLAVMVDRPTVVIDGTAYELRAIEQFSILEYQQHLAQAGPLMAFWARLEKDAAPFTAEEEAEAGRLLDACCRRVLAAPPAIHDQLMPMDRFRVVEAFYLLPELTGQLPRAKQPPRPTQTPTKAGASSSPDSPVSMAATH